MWLPALLAAMLGFGEADAELALRTAEGLVADCTPRDAGTVDGYRAATYLMDRASAAGGDVRRDRFSAMTPKGPRWFTNLECEIKLDASRPWVVFLSHYDTKPGVACPGANDGASTSGLLVALADVLSRNRRDLPFNVLLVWTDGEECFERYTPDDGFWGARRAAERLKASGRKVKAVVCLDMLGDRDLKIVLPRNASPRLRKVTLAAAKKAGVADKVVATDDLVKDDHLAFLRAGFPAVELIDFEYGSAPGRNDWWHTPADTMDKISADSLLIAGRLALAILAELK